MGDGGAAAAVGRPADRVLGGTRALSIAIIPFLVVAFVVLFFRPSADDTARLFAWRIAPPLTPMILGSVYLGGAYFFLRAAGARHWHRIEGGFVSVGVFASLMGVATILHWSRFIHGNVAFSLWAGLYLTTPFLVFGTWARNRRERTPPAPGDLLLPPVAVAVIGAVGVSAAFSSALLFLFPRVAIDVWPWRLTELTARVMAAIFALGIAGIGVLVEKRWTGARLLFQVEILMLVLILVAVVRDRRDIDAGRPLTWIFAVGFVGLSVATVAYYLHMEARHTEALAGPPAAPGELAV